jgi:hypothetical protein
MSKKHLQLDPVTFQASIPPTEQAIKIHGDGGARIVLDIAEANLAAFLPALPYRGQQILVTFRQDGSG